MAIKSKAKKATSKAKAGGGLKAAVGAVSGLIGGGKSGGTKKRRSRGPQYWANKVLVQKLKSKYNRLKYAGVGR